MESLGKTFPPKRIQHQHQAWTMLALLFVVRFPIDGCVYHLTVVPFDHENCFMSFPGAWPHPWRINHWSHGNKKKAFRMSARTFHSPETLVYSLSEFLSLCSRIVILTLSKSIRDANSVKLNSKSWNLSQGQYETKIGCREFFLKIFIHSWNLFNFILSSLGAKK